MFFIDSYSKYYKLCVFLDHTALVKYTLEDKYHTTFEMKNKTSLNGTSLHEEYQFIPINNKDIVVSVVYYEGLSDGNVVPPHYLRNISDDLQKQIKKICYQQNVK